MAREGLEEGRTVETYEKRLGLFPWGEKRKVAIEVLYSKVGRVINVTLTRAGEASVGGRAS
jgi:hypothetical protein